MGEKVFQHDTAPAATCEAGGPGSGRGLAGTPGYSWAVVAGCTTVGMLLSWLVLPEA